VAVPALIKRSAVQLGKGAGRSREKGQNRRRMRATKAVQSPFQKARMRVD